ncbi:sugar diacid utilization regulator [Kibdelosporangium banguiense]|uniref:Sugar diacid utilization regulator n=1 Tax=Kibdelosporangium banguiense TaxID=1365924 RepID=A0ABS4TY71_9PSEU|nr:helix-turn-helix domain-containing protein [Kibdelosporangium banguiense]MBP2328958.1 sugar diacid utilization regulator [Kibdelosporangium banguiense]
MPPSGPRIRSGRAAPVLDEVQRSIDDLAETLRRSITVDDPNLKLISHTRSFGDEDTTRVQSIINRRLGDDVMRHLLVTHRLRSLREPLRLSPDDLAGSHARVVVPLWHREEPCGFLTLIDRDESLEEEDLREVVKVSARIAEVLYRRQRSLEVQESERERILCELILGDGPSRVRAADDMRELGLINDVGIFHVLTLAYPSARARLRPLKTLVARRLEVRAYRSWLVAGVGDSVVLLAAGDPGPEERNIRALAEQLNRMEDGGERPTVAIGGAVSSLEEVAKSYEQASAALRADHVLRRQGVIDWDELEPGQMLAVLAPSPPPAHLVPPRLASMGEVLSDELLATLRCFLENMGDVSKVAEKLYVHRSTVYYRISRVEELMGLSLSDGTVRLVLHWWLRSADLRDGHQSL